MPKLTVNEGALSGYTHTAEFDFNDLKALGNNGSVAIATIPAGGSVEVATVHKLTAAAGSTTVVFNVGTTGADPDEFIDALDADGMTNPVSNTGDTYTTAQSQPIGYAAATDILFKVTDSSVANLTAGKWIVGLRILDLAQFAKKS